MIQMNLSLFSQRSLPDVLYAAFVDVSHRVMALVVSSTAADASIPKDVSQVHDPGTGNPFYHCIPDCLRPDIASPGELSPDLDIDFLAFPVLYESLSFVFILIHLDELNPYRRFLMLTLRDFLDYKVNIADYGL